MSFFGRSSTPEFDQEDPKTRKLFVESTTSDKKLASIVNQTQFHDTKLQALKQIKNPDILAKLCTTSADVVVKMLAIDSLGEKRGEPIWHSPSNVGYERTPGSPAVLTFDPELFVLTTKRYTYVVADFALLWAFELSRDQEFARLIFQHRKLEDIDLIRRLHGAFNDPREFYKLLQRHVDNRIIRQLLEAVPDPDLACFIAQTKDIWSGDGIELLQQIRQVIDDPDELYGILLQHHHVNDLIDALPAFGDRSEIVSDILDRAERLIVDTGNARTRQSYILTLGLLGPVARAERVPFLLEMMKDMEHSLAETGDEQYRHLLLHALGAIDDEGYLRFILENSGDYRTVAEELEAQERSSNLLREFEESSSKLSELLHEGSNNSRDRILEMMESPGGLANGISQSTASTPITSETGSPQSKVQTARTLARLAIDSNDAQEIDRLFRSNDPVQSLAAALEFNINWGCCRRGWSSPGRLYTLGGTFFCTHCKHETQFGTSYYSDWFEDPHLSTAGGHRHPPTLEENGRDGGYEAVEFALNGLEALSRDDVDGYLGLLQREDRLSLRIFMLKIEELLSTEQIPHDVAIERIEDAARRFHKFYDYNSLRDQVGLKRVYLSDS